MWADVVSFEVGTQCVSRTLPGFLSSYKDVGEQCEAAACIEFFFADLTWSCVLCSMTPTGVNPHYLLRGIMRITLL